MPGQRYQRVREIFHQACELPTAEQRLDFLNKSCGDDDELRAEVQSLLQHDRDAADAFHDEQLGFGRALVEQAHADAAGSGAGNATMPETIGDYRILRKIGEGGVGVVYEAQQQHPRRRVALKLLRPGFATENLLRRFAQEAELLARFQHSGIAYIYEAGSTMTPFGEQPFFAMELVDGEPLNDYARRRKLSVRQRMALFAQVCDAVHHAHTRGIIHRDLKPANILVVEQQSDKESGDPTARDTSPTTDDHLTEVFHKSRKSPPTCQIKVLDFGIARATDADVKITTIQTAIGQLIGTVPYMSPEQVRGDASQLDARSDVYSLGVVLYELLSDRLPYDLSNRSIPEAVRLIQEGDPTRLSSINRVFRGDIDTIVSKALEKEKSRRYQSAQELGTDIRRYLADEPLVARPASTTYQLRKFARRNRALVSGVLIGCAAIIAGLIVAVHQAVVATKAKEAAELREQLRLQQTYLASITAAASALEKHDVALARRSLAMAPQSLREWEWDHLSGRLDESLQVIPTPGALAGAAPWFASGDAGLAVFLATAEGVLAWNAESGEAVDCRLPRGALFASDHRAGAVAFLTSGKLHVQVSGADHEYDTSDLGSLEDVTRIALSDNGRFVAFAAPQSVTRLDLNENALDSIAIDNRGTGIDGLAVTSDGIVAIASALEGRPAIWRPGAALMPFQEVAGVARSVDVSPDGRQIVLGLQDTAIGLWNSTDGTLVTLGRGHRHAVTGVAFAPDGDRIASVSLDRTVRIWQTEELRPFSTMHGHDRGVWHVTFSPDGTRLASTGEDGTIRIWDAQRRLGRNVLVGHEGLVFAVAFSPDGQQLASAGWDHTIRLWNTSTCKLITLFPVETDVVTALSFSSDGRLLAWVGEQRFGARDLQSGANIAPESSALPNISVTIKCFKFIHDTAVVPLPWTLSADGVTVWNVRKNAFEQWTGAELTGRRAAFLSPNGRFAVGVSLQADSQDVRQARSDSGSPLVVADFSSGTLVDTPSFSGPFALCPTPERPLLAARRADDTTRVQLWDLEEAKLVGELIGHTDSVYAIAFAPDGKRIATAGRDSLRLWDATSFTEIVQLRGHTSFIWALAFSPDGSQLASGSGDRTVRLWNGVRSEQHVDD